MLKIGLAALLALTLGACQTTATKPKPLTAAEFDAPIRPGETRLRLQNGRAAASTRSAPRAPLLCAGRWPALRPRR
jgi:hypothetical protein